MKRSEFSADALDARQLYRMLTSLVIPRPIAWVSTISEDGVTNLAPHSFFSIVSSDPGIVQFTSTSRKDSLRNIEATGEFVVNLVTVPSRHLTNQSSTPFEYGVSEFTALGIATEESLTVKPPRVADSPAAIECVVERILQVGNGHMAFGRVQHIAVNSDVIDDQGHPKPDALDPIARLGSNEWAGLGDLFAIDRLTVEDWNNGKR